MRKFLLLIVALLGLGVSGAWAEAAYTGIKLTFSRADSGSGTATNAVSDVTVNVADQNGNAIDGVTATLASTTITELKTGSAAALSRTSNAVLAPNAGYTNAKGESITYTFQVQGLSTEFVYDRAAIDVYALNSSGGSQDQGQVRPWNIDISTGDAIGALTSLVSEENYNIVGTDVDGGIRHKFWSKVGDAKNSTETLYIKITLTRGDQGCYAGISEVRLYGLGTHTWESKSGWTMATGGTAVVYGFGVHTPNGFESFKINQIQVSQLTGDNGNEECYLAITTTAATSSSTSVNYSDVVAISDNHLAPSSNTATLETYTFSNEVCLSPNTTYHLIFLSSKEQTNGSYTAKATRIALNHTTYGQYSYGVYSRDAATTTNWWPYFCATLTDVDDTNVYITNLAPMYNDKAYVITNGRGTWQFDGESAKGMGISASQDLSADNQKIVIIKQDDQYYLYSVAAGKYLTKTNKLYKSPLDPVTITESTAANGNYKWFFSFDSNHNINTADDPDLFLTIDTWTTHDTGNTCALIEVANFDNTDALAAFTNYDQRITDYCNYHTEVGQDFAQSYYDKVGYPSQSSTGYTNLSEIMLKQSDATIDDWNNLPGYYATYLAETNIKTPPAGFYRIYHTVSSDGTKKYLTDTGSALVATTSVDDAKKSVFYWDGSTLVAYNGGYYINQVSRSLTAATFTFTKSNQGTFGQMNVNPSSGSPWYVEDATGEYTLNRWSGGGQVGSNFQVEAVTSLPITFKGEYASFFSPVDLTIPDNADLKVYTGTVNGEWLTLNEITGTLPANTGVILHLDNWTEETTVNFPILSTVNEENTTALIGTVAARAAVDGGVLVLGKSGDDWGIYNYTGELGGFKAYMNKPAGVKGFAFSFGDVDAIATLLNGEQGTKEVFDLSGRKVSQPTRGLYIVNGKKVIIK
ncbi:MAG: hypothetical protein J6I36_03630 [Bacteroidaceae bacterium]|nr:hypothetical protein [Bacteroidaceae bacterium]